MKQSKLKEIIISHLKDFGFKLDDSSKLNEFILGMSLENDFLRKQFELFNGELIIALKELEKQDNKNYKFYLKTLLDAEVGGDFWGERFELLFHHKLLNAQNQKIITELQRGKEGREPDLLFLFQDYKIGVELTTLKFTKAETSADYVLNKILDSIVKKSRNKYAEVNTTLVIDITNLAFNNSIFTKGTLLDLITVNESKISEVSSKFGMVLFTESVFNETAKKDLKRITQPITATFQNPEIFKFFKVLFNDFERQSKTVLRHKNL
jgi:hypothetical protein